jgi:hypothetical protein
VVDIDVDPGTSAGSNVVPLLRVLPYDPAPRRETVRTWLAVGFSAFYRLDRRHTCCGFDMALDHSINPLLTGLFTPFLGVTGTIIGFYFSGGHPPTH